MKEAEERVVEGVEGTAESVVAVVAELLGSSESRGGGFKVSSRRSRRRARRGERVNLQLLACWDWSDSGRY